MEIASAGPLKAVADMEAAIAQVEEEDVYDLSVSAADTNYDLLKDLNVRVPGVISGNLEEGDVLSRELDEVYAVQSRTAESVMERSRKVVSLWNMVNTQRVAAALPALLLGTTGVVDLQTALDGHPDLLQTVEDQKAELNKKKSQLKGTDHRVDKNNKRWYTAWSGNYVVGSPENDALSQIATENTAPPTVGKAVITHAMFVPAGSTAHLDIEAEHAAEFKVLRKGPGQTVFTLRAEHLTEPMFQESGLTAGTYAYQAVGGNSGGDGETSDPVNVVVP